MQEYYIITTYGRIM